MLRRVLLLTCVLAVTFVATPAVSFTQNDDDDWEKKHKKYLRKQHEEKFVKTIDKLYQLILGVDQYNLREKGITDPEKLIEAYNKYVNKPIGEPHGYKERIETLGIMIKKKRVTSNFVLKKLISMYYDQKTGAETLSKTFWDKILSILFYCGDKSLIQWGISKVEELELDFRKGFYAQMFETYSIGPLTTESYMYLELDEFEYNLYVNVVPLIDQKEFKPVASLVLSNIYTRLMNDIYFKIDYKLYFEVIKKYVKMPKYMIEKIPEYDGYDNPKFKKKIRVYFREFFAMFPKAEWNTKKQQFIFPKQLQTQPQTKPAEDE